MPHVRGIPIFNENQGVTPRLKNNVTQSAKKVFGERKNILHTEEKLPALSKSAVKQQFKPQIMRQLPNNKTKPQLTNNNKNKHINFDEEFLDFVRPCCLEDNRKTTEEIWSDMNMLDDNMIDDLLKTAFSKNDVDENDHPHFLERDDDVLPLFKLDLDTNLDSGDLFFSPPEMPRI